MPILLYGIVALAYAGLAYHFWRTRWGAGLLQAAAPWERIAILAPLCVHSWLLYQNLFAAAEFRFGFGYALSSMLWLPGRVLLGEGLVCHHAGLAPYSL